MPKRPQTTPTPRSSTPAKARKPASKPKPKQPLVEKDTSATTKASLVKKVSSASKKPPSAKKPKIVKQASEQAPVQGSYRVPEEGPEFYERIDKLIDKERNVDNTPAFMRTRGWSMEDWDAERSRLYQDNPDAGKVDDTHDEEQEPISGEDDDGSEMADFIVD